ncbi:LacI family DNA-binding transcriptional regulator [Pseudonocardia sp. ICBG1293]|uniref:LacI family DNA-binding transcriptional regulator n=1 Tax=Pseudonocardia sp. ICBG1293 TaxID=2844382 RepID=UPI001CCA1B7E|nr:LacI family DNA-binding transcriptional regulator [Pseudonocardia sp. ICBG1293]
MSDVAERAGVSRALVSIVFRDRPGASDATRARVLAAADELGYTPDSAARLLARGRSRTIGVLTTVGEPFEASLIEGVYAEAGHHGYGVLLSARTPGHDEQTAVDELLAHRCEALVLLGPEAPEAELTALAQRTVLVVVGRGVRGVDSVRTDDEAGLRGLTEHLIAAGHRRITHVDGGPGANAAARRDGYTAAMTAAGLGGQVHVLPGAYDEEAGIAAAHRLLAGGAGGPVLPTAVVAGNDRCAVGLLDTLRRSGVDVPGRMSVAGYNDDRVSRLAHVDLTTVRQDAAALARGAVDAVRARLDDPATEPVDLVLDPHLVVRGSTGPAH